MQKRVFSGVQPSGNLHIGNYLGAIKRWVDLQDQYDNIFCIVDLHAITVPQDPKILKAKIREVAALYIASGIDPQKSKVFVQSHISAHTELAWILNCFIPLGWMGRMTQFKEKSEKIKESASVGLFDYPALMAADILLYQTDLVPVGDDQKQHVELTRDVAQKFNNLYGSTFNLPEAMIGKEGARIMGLDDPTKKMSKSDLNPGQAISLLDNPELIKTKIMGAVTDSGQEIRFDEKRPGIYNLLVIYQIFSRLNREKIENKFVGRGYSEFKFELTELVIEGLKPLQSKFVELTSDPTYLDNILKEGVDQIRPIAEKTLAEVKEKVGLG